MKFEQIVKITGKTHGFLEKFNFENLINVDTFIDNHCPEIASKLQTYIDKKIAVLSTNGSDVAVNVINQILKRNKNTIITNVLNNSKKIPPLTAIMLALYEDYKNFCETKTRDYFTNSIDELELNKNFQMIKYNYLLLNNIFYHQKDSLSLSEKKKKIQNAITLNPKLDLIINADDPVFFEIDEIQNDTITNKKRNKIYYGFEEIEIFDNNKEILQKTDFLRCPVCGCKLEYEELFYSHFGKYKCECGFKRPPLTYSASAKIFNNYSFLTVFAKDYKMIFKLPFGGVINAYQALSAIVFALSLNIDRKTIATAFEKYETIKGLDEIIRYKTKEIKIKTFDNATTLNDAILELNNSRDKKVLFCFNSDEEKNIDTSWIWGANFNVFKNYENKIYICSKRLDDMALRLKYADVNPSLISMDNNIKSAFEYCFYELEKNESMLILTVPSLINEVYKVLKF